MPPLGHKSVTVSIDTWKLIDDFRAGMPLEVPYGEVVRAALLVLCNQADPLAAVAAAKRRRQELRRP